MISQSISQLVKQSLYEALNQTVRFIWFTLITAGLKHKTYSTYITEDNRGSWLMKVLVQSFCGISSAKKNSKYSMKLISYFQNRPIPIKVKPCFTDTRLVRKAYHCRQFAWSLGKESCNLSLINSTCSIYFIYFILLFCHTQ